MEKRLVDTLNVGDVVTLVEINGAEIVKKLSTKIAKIEKFDSDWSTLTSIHLDDGTMVTDNMFFKNEHIIFTDYAGKYTIIYKGTKPADELPARIEFKRYIELKIRENEEYSKRILEGNKNLEEIINLLHV